MRQPLEVPIASRTGGGGGGDGGGGGSSNVSDSSSWWFSLNEDVAEEGGRG